MINQSWVFYENNVSKALNNFFYYAKFPTNRLYRVTLMTLGSGNSHTHDILPSFMSVTTFRFIVKVY